MKRYPLEPLAAALGVKVESLARELDIRGSTWQEYRDLGVSEKVADRLAAKAGIPAYTVWPEMLDDSIAKASKRCGNCDDPFVPKRSDQLYCSVKCRKKVSLRRWRQRPNGRQWEREARRRRYAETGEYDRAWARAYHAANRDQERERNRQYRLRKKAQSTGTDDGNVAA